MKTIIFTLMLLASISASAQKIINDQTVGDIRRVSTETFAARAATDTKVWVFGLHGYAPVNSPDSAAYEMTLNLNVLRIPSIPENATLLIKTFDDEVIELHCTESYSGTPVFVTSHYGKFTMTNAVTAKTAGFIVSPAELEKMKNGIKKLRLKTNDGYLDKEYKKDKAGEKLYQCYESIKSKLNEKSKSIHDGF